MAGIRRGSKPKSPATALARAIEAIGAITLDVAIATGIRPGSLYDWQSGKTTPRVEFALKLVRHFRAKGYECSVETLFPLSEREQAPNNK